MSDQQRWHTRSDWATAHLLRPGVTRHHAGDRQAGITLCGRPLAHFYPAAYSALRCGQCTRRSDTERDSDGS